MLLVQLRRQPDHLRPTRRVFPNHAIPTRWVVQPLLVVHQADQWVLLGHVGQQAQHSQPDQEAVRRRPRAKAERVRSASPCGTSNHNKLNRTYCRHRRLRYDTLTEGSPQGAMTGRARNGRRRAEAPPLTDALRRLVWALVMQAMRSSVLQEPAAPIRLPEQACHDWSVTPMRL
jgi:hypothetical protein